MTEEQDAELAELRRRFPAGIAARVTTDEFPRSVPKGTVGTVVRTEYAGVSLMVGRGAIYRFAPDEVEPGRMEMVFVPSEPS